MRRVLFVGMACAALGLACSSGSGNDDGATADHNGGGPNVTGTLTLPAAASGKPYSVKLFTMAGFASLTATSETSGTVPDGTTISYGVAGVPAGTYFILGFVDVDGSGGTSSTPGDYAGWYGHNGDGNPPAAANAAVPTSGNVSFDFSLVLR